MQRLLCLKGKRAVNAVSAVSGARVLGPFLGKLNRKYTQYILILKH